MTSALYIAVATFVFGVATLLITAEASARRTVIVDVPSDSVAVVDRSWHADHSNARSACRESVARAAEVPKVAIVIIVWLAARSAVVIPVGQLLVIGLLSLALRREINGDDLIHGDAARVAAMLVVTSRRSKQCEKENEEAQLFHTVLPIILRFCR